MPTLTKILLASLVILLTVTAGGALVLMYRPLGEPLATPIPSPSPLPSATPVADPNPFGAEALNPFEDTEAQNPFTTPAAEDEYINPFADL